MSAMRASVIFSTYESPVWLEKVLWGFATQTSRDFEVLVADDGSSDATRAVIDRMRGEVFYPVRHVWQPHDGFGKCRILNKAIAQAESDYCIFTDGDCIPRRDFVAVHLAHARHGEFLSGGYLILPMATSQAITKDDILAGRATDYAWLRAHGAPRSRPLMRLRWGPRMSAVLDAVTTTGATFNGHNSSVWLEDLVRVNGFDERLQWGGLDRELGERLTQAGIPSRQIRHQALVVHLDHPRGYKNPAGLAANRAIRDEVAARRLTRAPVGLDQYLTANRSAAAARRPG
jgi:glycosyltransferase involved in cell wall biosynthesis